MDAKFLQILNFYEQIYDLPLFRFGLLTVAILFFLFTVGLVRQHYFHLTMRGANFGFLAGVIFVLVIESLGMMILIYGPRAFEIVLGKYSMTEVAQLTKQGVGRVGAVLGQTTCANDRPTATSILEEIPKLSKIEEDKVRYVLCR